MHKRQSAIRAAFPHTLPVMTGYLFLGMAFGILLASKGYDALWALLMSVFVFAGSMQFVAVGLLAGGFQPLAALFLALMVNARHIFYGIAMLERFKGMGRKRPYMIFALTDETFSLLLSAKAPEGVDEDRFALAIAALDQIYWVTGSVIGGIMGAAIPFNTQGIEFVMTALFVVIFLEQWQTAKGRVPALMGVLVALICLVVFGPQWFLLPTMAALVMLLLAAREPLTRRLDR